VTSLDTEFKKVEMEVVTENRTDETSSLQKFMQSFQKLEVIFEEGSTGDEMYLIHSGKVSLQAGHGTAGEVTLAVLNPGDFFGEMALVDNYERSATAVATEDNTQLIALDKAKFMFMIQQQPQFALTVMHTLGQRIRNLDKQLSSPGGSV